ncbi:hypothetical protein [Bradyrhizobium sp.]|uniref:hypothetical protein n=1 Tax=Bradyrhizobium sp. TaxID=376 RepID=UPI0025BDC3C2|nr:hypothetical protein [Bradyrhizobium sp.]
MTKVIFRCPQTGVNVERLIEEDTDATPNEFLPVRCPACGRTHFINRATQKLLGQEESQPAKSQGGRA